MVIGWGKKYDDLFFLKREYIDGIGGKMREKEKCSLYWGKNIILKRGSGKNIIL